MPLVITARMKLLAILSTLMGLAALGGCGYTKQDAIAPDSSKAFSETTFAPDSGQIILFVGQDLDSVRDYTRSECCPVPAGITTYIGLFNVLDPNVRFGGMGIDENQKPLDDFANWGAGDSSLYTVMQEYPDSAIAIGLSMTENEHPGAMKELIAGERDREIKHLATLLKKHPRPVFLRIGYEFDGMWNAGYGDTQQYIDGYKRIVDVFRAEKADNVTYVWQASSSPTDDSIEGRHENIRLWYPGDEYVDWMALSWFLVPDFVGPNSSYPATQNGLADEMVVFARERNKPVMIAEATPIAYDLKQGFKAFHSPVWDGTPKSNITEKSGQQIWDEWFHTFFEYIYENSDVIRSVAYINANWDGQPMWSGNYDAGYWGDSRVSENPVVLTNWLNEISQPIWFDESKDWSTKAIE